MADQSNRISQLKIDRSTPTTAGRKHCASSDGDVQRLKVSTPSSNSPLRAHLRSSR